MVQNESDASKAIEDIQKRLSDTIKQAALDDFKNFQSIADKYAEMEDKIAEVERKRLEDQALSPIELLMQLLIWQSWNCSCL